MRTKYNKNLDYNGELAQKGTPDYELVKHYCSDIFFSEKPLNHLKEYL